MVLLVLLEVLVTEAGPVKTMSSSKRIGDAGKLGNVFRDRLWSKGYR